MKTENWYSYTLTLPQNSFSYALNTVGSLVKSVIRIYIILTPAESQVAFCEYDFFLM